MERRVRKNNQVSAGQIAFILIAVLTIGKLFYLPGLMYAESGRDSWLAGAILAAVELGVLFLIFWICRRHSDKTLYELLSGSFGKIAAKVLLCLLASFYLLHFVYYSAENYNYLNLVTMQKTNWLSFVIPLFFLAGFMAYKGLNILARCSDIFAPLVFIAAAVIFVFSLSSADLENILPVGITGAGSIARGVMNFGGWFSDCSLLLIFAGKSQTAKKHKLKSAAAFTTGAVLTTLLVAGFFVLFPAVFGATAGGENFALAHVSGFVSPSSFLGHADRAAITVWTFGSLLKIGLFAYAALECVLQAFSVPKGKAKAFVLAGLLVAAAILPVITGIEYILKDMFRSIWFLITAGVFAMLLPLYLFIFARRKTNDAETQA